LIVPKLGILLIITKKGIYKEIFQTADLIKNDQVVFNIKGNHYRLIAAVDFNFNVVYIKWFGKHKDYNKIGPSEVKHEYPPC
jgi:mRNA interferase HigB